eukprot:CAMPEP_0198570582 /NCGR_PEP_ID=MMETSP1462-20131121/109290_1 /TAXON_ID=1333877 /ORGANISM="Brandtodinium nutriculum, Strain RCC3387" /LENGTH=98 /DNA_ID=CAMNT_0044301703 /DNA_START=156 /DNA_END=450 /DNA_ORIENTATION=-
MSFGWEHYDEHLPERHVLLFRRIRGTDPQTGTAPPDMVQKAAERQRYVAELEEQRQRLIMEKMARQDDADMFDLAERRRRRAALCYSPRRRVTRRGGA